MNVPEAVTILEELFGPDDHVGELIRNGTARVQEAVEIAMEELRDRKLHYEILETGEAAAPARYCAALEPSSGLPCARERHCVSEAHTTMRPDGVVVGWMTREPLTPFVKSKPLTKKRQAIVDRIMRKTLTVGHGGKLAEKADARALARMKKNPPPLLAEE